MVSLTSVAAGFEIPCTVIEGGSGVFRGIICETNQDSLPSYIFTNPRQVLRVRLPQLLATGMVIRTPAGMNYIVAQNGPSELPEGTVWQSYRLFAATGQYLWQTRKVKVDPITQMPRDDGLTEGTLIWAAVEPLDREPFDRKIRVSIEQSRVLAGKPIQSDDVLAGQTITRALPEIGVYVGIIN